MSAVYKRILLKLSGEVLAGPKTTGIDNDTVVTICKSIKAVADLGVEVAIDDGEVVAVVLDVEHVAVADGEAFND